MNQTTQADDDRVILLVQEALNLPKEERVAFLKQACQSDLNLFEQAREILRTEERMGEFLKTPAIRLSEPVDSFEPGQLLTDRFRIIRQIGHGGMGVVWEAYDELLERRVAIKCAKPGFSKQLRPEVRHAREISHINVCKLFDIHTTKTPAGRADFACMEFIDGKTLTARLKEGPIPAKERVEIGLQICAGLSSAHAQGIIHGDLKSLNIMLTTAPNGGVRAVIMDFGLARAPESMGEAETKKMFAGTPAYMAPELRKTLQSSIAADIYALGVIFWEMLSGKQPRDIPVTLARVAGNSTPVYKTTKGFGRWDHVLACCLEEDPARRFSSAEDVAISIRPPRSRKWFLMAAAALVLATVSSLLVYHWSTIPPQTVRLAALPFDVNGNEANVKTLMAETSVRLSRLKSDTHTSFTFVPLTKVLYNQINTSDKGRQLSGTTHILRGTIDDARSSITVHVFLVDAKSGVVTNSWLSQYTPGEMKFLPAAATGFVTETFGLPIAKVDPVNSAAAPNYQTGLLAVQQNRRVDEALHDFELAVAADPDSPLVYAGLAEAQLLKHALTQDKKWLERSIESTRRASNRDPDMPSVHRIVGLLKSRGGWYDQAKTEYLRAIALEPRNSEAHRRLGQSYEDSNQIDDALVEFQKAVAVDPKEYKNVRDLAFFYGRRGKYEEAIKYLREAVTLAPMEPLIHSGLGVNLLNLGRFSDAEQEFRRSAELAETAHSFSSLGVVLMYEGREHEAISALKHALALGPSTSIWMNLGIASQRTGLQAQADDAFKKARDSAQAEMVKNPRYGVPQARLAYICAQLGDKSRADFEIQQALHQWPNDADTRFMAVLTYEALGNRDQAIAVLEGSVNGVIFDVSRWPYVADLLRDSRFIKLLDSSRRNERNVH